VEIGFDHRQQRCPSDCACLHQFMKYTGPSKRTPEFSLESGLGPSVWVEGPGGVWI
jgi:hypothetical protein